MNTETANGLKIMNTVMSYSSISEVVIIPDNVERINDDVFAGKYIRKLIMGKNLREIGARAFEQTDITEAIFPDKVSIIEKHAFEDCKYLKKVVLPQNKIAIKTHCFAGCDMLSELFLNEGLSAIPDAAFAYCKSLTTVTIPDSAKYIGISAFEACTSLSYVRIGSDVQGISSKAFYYCSSLSDIFIPKSVRTLGMDCFNKETRAFYEGTESEFIKMLVRTISPFSEVIYNCTKEMYDEYRRV